MFVYATRGEGGGWRHGEVSAAADGAQRVREGGGALPAALREGARRGLRGGELARARAPAPQRPSSLLAARTPCVSWSF